MGKKLEKMAKTAKNGQLAKISKTGKNRREWPKLVKKNCQNGQKLVKMGKNGQKLAETAKKTTVKNAQKVMS